MRSHRIRLYTVTLTAAGSLLSGCAADAGPEFLSIGTAGTGGIYYPIGGALASRLSALDPGRRFTAEVTGGSVENVNRLVAGQIDIGFALGTTIHEAYYGGPDFPEPRTSLRIIAPLYPNVTHILVPRGSPIRSVGELRGQRVSVGSAGSGTEQVARHLLEAFDLDYDDVRPRYLSFTESSAALRDGAIAAAIMSVGYPASAVLEVTTTGDARLIGIHAERIDWLGQRYPYYRAGIIPAGAYRGVATDVPTVEVMNWLVATDALADDVVTAILDILADEGERLERVNEIARQIRLERLHDAPIPLHPAAATWAAGRGIAGGG